MCACSGGVAALRLSIHLSLARLRVDRRHVRMCCSGYVLLVPPPSLLPFSFAPSLSLSLLHPLGARASPLRNRDDVRAARGAFLSPSLAYSRIHIHEHYSPIRFPRLTQHYTTQQFFYRWLLSGASTRRVRVCVCVYICLHFRATYVHLNSHQDCCGGSTRTCRCCCCHRSATAYEITRTFKPT